MGHTSREKVTQERGNFNGWAYVKDVAEREIQGLEERIRHLKGSIAMFEDFSQRGEPWPGTVGLEESQGVVSDSLKRTQARSKEGIRER